MYEATEITLNYSMYALRDMSTHMRKCFFRDFIIHYWIKFKEIYMGAFPWILFSKLKKQWNQSNNAINTSNCNNDIKDFDCRYNN